MTVNKVRRNGSYAPLSAHYYKDDAIDEAGEAAELLYVRGLAFCADVLSDGFISDRQLVRFVGVGMFDATERAARLVEVGLWERLDGGYEVRSWLTWNRSREEITDALAKDRGRKGSSGASAESEQPPPDPPNGGGQPGGRNPNGIRTESDVQADGTPAGVQPRARTPRHSTPRNSTPSQDTPADESSAELDGMLLDVPAVPPLGFDDFWKLYPKKVKKQGAVDSWQSKVVKAKVPADLVLTALRAHIVHWQRRRDFPKYVPDPTTWLNGRRWQDELGPPLAAVSGDDYVPYSNPEDESVWDAPLLPPNPREEP